MDVLKIIATALLSVVALFVITKIMGHKQVSQLDFFDYVSGITIGSIGAELATELESPEKPLIALTVYGLASILLSFVTHKIPSARKYVNGAPTVLMDNGKLYRENMKRAKLDLSEFLLLCREQGYFDVREIQTAVFEYNGKLSILPRAVSKPVTPQDLKIPVKAVHIGLEIIMDGHLIPENLTRIGRDEKWLESTLASKGCNIGEIFLAIYDQDKDDLTLYKSRHNN